MRITFVRRNGCGRYGVVVVRRGARRPGVERVLVSTRRRSAASGRKYVSIKRTVDTET